MSRKQLALLEPTLVRQALLDAVKKLSPMVQWRNPVMFIVWVGSLLTTLLAIAMAGGALTGSATLPPPSVSGCGLPCCSPTLPKRWRKAAAKPGQQPERGEKTAFARKLRAPQHDATVDHVPAEDLRKGDVVLVEAGDIIPCDGEVIEGGASVDESAITGESAPVIRESGGDFASVTGGTRILSDWLVIRCSVNPGETFLDRMIAMVEGAQRRKTPNEIALTILLIALTLVFLLATATIWPFSAGAAMRSASPCWWRCWCA
jgi:K+-transporting ATPase ATPase B chain